MDGLVTAGAEGGCAASGPVRQRTIELAAPTTRLREIGCNFTGLGWAVSSRPASQRKRSAVLDEGPKAPSGDENLPKRPIDWQSSCFNETCRRAILPFSGAITVAPSGPWNGDNFSEGHENSFD